MPAFGAQELSNLVWSFAVLGVKPPVGWLRAFEVQVCALGGDKWCGWGKGCGAEDCDSAARTVGAVLALC